VDKIPRISDAEWEIMKILWERSPLTSSEIVGSLPPRLKWKRATVKTLIRRLQTKGAIAYRKDERASGYCPLVSKEACVLEESRNFLQRVYDGECSLLLAGFLRSEPISDEEIEELRKLLDKRRGK
jgi:BlaI family transcriptional regulator, penicillinase repressor